MPAEGRVTVPARGGPSELLVKKPVRMVTGSPQSRMPLPLTSSKPVKAVARLGCAAATAAVSK